MKYNLTAIMVRAWKLRKAKGYTLCTALKIAWAEAKGGKRYAFRLEDARASISAYLVKLLRAGFADIHEQHKHDVLCAALLLPCDALGIAVMDGKTCGLCKYAARNAV